MPYTVGEFYFLQPFFIMYIEVTKNNSFIKAFPRNKWHNADVSGSSNASYEELLTEK